MLLAHAKIENSMYSAKHIVSGNFACYVAEVVDAFTQNGSNIVTPVIFLEYARHGVFFCSCCNLLSDERLSHSGVYSPLFCWASLLSSSSTV